MNEDVAEEILEICGELLLASHETDVTLWHAALEGAADELRGIVERARRARLIPIRRFGTVKEPS